MANDTTGAMEKLSALIAEIEAGAYARGQADARKELLDMLGAGERAAPARARRGSPAAPERRAGGRKRAPRGSVPALWSRPCATVRVRPYRKYWPWPPPTRNGRSSPPRPCGRSPESGRVPEIFLPRVPRSAKRGGEPGADAERKSSGAETRTG